MSSVQFRQLTVSDVPAFAEMGLKAYPGFGFSAQAKEEAASWLRMAVEVFPPNDLWGLFDGGALVAGMGTLRFDTNVRGALVPTWGAGSVAVDMLHKRQGLAHQLLSHYLAEARRQGYTLASLFPFRVDFYRKMGFGHAARRHQYRIKPSSFPKTGGTEHLAMVDHESEADRAAVLACYNRFLARTHGAVSKVDSGLGDLINSAHRAVIFRRNEEVQGYIIYTFQVEKKFKYHMLVKEFIWENADALHALLTFLHNQQDQVERIVINTPDDLLHLLVSDPASGRYEAFDSDYLELMATAVGGMYRVIDLPGLLGRLAGQRIGYGTHTVRIHLKDAFFPQGASQAIVRVEDGVLLPAGDHQPDSELSIDVGEFSSLLMGGADLFTLHRYGLISLSDDRHLHTLAGIFAAPHQPMWTSLHF